VSYSSWIFGEVKRTIQKDIRPKRARGQNWKTFLRNHAAEIWACDCLQVTDLFFRPLFAFFIIELQSRKVIHVHVTRAPTDPWVARTVAGGDSVWTSSKIVDSGE
jgi:putative transposase